jgi:pimeloyl-ACP methyl ester carboxylesterase
MIKKDLLMKISAITILLLLLSISSREFPNSANGQTVCDNGTIVRSNQALPVILIHGYKEGSSIWSQWEQLLSKNSIPFCTVSFHQSNDHCGSAVDHAKELRQIVQEVKGITEQSQVNIVAHSKGGLDARVYLASGATNDIANLIMLGTPNAGGPLADLFFASDTCRPAIFDLKTGAPDTMAKQNIHTQYYTIAGECLPFLELPFFGIVIPEPNDGIVPLSSVESLPYSISLGHTLHCHLDLTSELEYGLAQSILLGGR